MENIKWLREQLNLSLRDVEKYTGISNVSLSRIETGKQGLNKKNMMILLQFYWVSSDFLLDKSEFGVYATNWDTEVQSMSRSQVISAFNHIKQTVDSFKNANGTYSYSVHRQLDESYSRDYQGWMDKAIDDLREMDSGQLQKTIRFMEDYILK